MNKGEDTKQQTKEKRQNDRERRGDEMTNKGE